MCVNVCMPLQVTLSGFRKGWRDSNCCVFPLMCNATQPATINLLRRNVGGPRIPIKSSSVCEYVFSRYVLTHMSVGYPQRSVLSRHADPPHSH